MSACVAEAATPLLEPMATGVTGHDDAYKISTDEKSYTECLIMTRSQLREMRNVSK